MAPSVILLKSQHEVSLVEVSTLNSLPGIVTETAGSVPSVEAPRLESRPPDPASPRGLAGFGALGRL